MTLRIQASLALLFILFALLPPASQADELILNVNLDDASTQKALILGNVDDPSCLPFLDSCQTIQEDNGQIYAVCDSFIEEKGSVRTLHFPATGYFEVYHASFFIVGGEEFSEINASSGLQFFSTKYNNS